MGKKNQSKINMIEYRNNETFHAMPKPGKNMNNVPVRTSFFIVLNILEDKSDKVDPDSISIQLTPENGESYYIFSKYKKFNLDYTGDLFEINDRRTPNAVAVYVDSKVELKPLTKYTFCVTAASYKGLILDSIDGVWDFTTAAALSTHKINYKLDVLNNEPIKWNGQLFSGFNRPDFCTSDHYYNSKRYSFYSKARKEYPRTWNLFRDFSVTGFDGNYIPSYPHLLANIVREKETRRIISIERNSSGVLIGIEDFFGHEQYGIESNRRLSDDYHKGDEVTVAGGYFVKYDILNRVDLNSARTKVIMVDDESNKILLTDFDDPKEGWKIEYPQPLPKTEDPRAPGLFPMGGVYLRKFDPVGTPCYYWGRIDHEWDNMHTKYGFRMVVGFFSSPGDTSLDGNNWTLPKDYLQFRNTVYDITSHLIERYGDATLDWYWSALLEPDLVGPYWRTDEWNVVLKFYDYMADGVLRAFEDNGYDPEDVFVGGFELAAIKGTDLHLNEILTHCSPNADVSEGVLPLNEAYSDKRLDGKRSKYLERFCMESDGKGSPIRFISIHSYNTSELSAAKLIKAKEMALGVDPEHYEKLWITDFESVPDWVGVMDPGAAECYLGNGYFPTWTADFISRLLHKADKDTRYAYGEIVYTIWNWPLYNFEPMNDVARAILIDEDGDGKKDRIEMIPTPNFHFTNLFSTMEKFWMLPEMKIGNHMVSGFASPGEDSIKIVVYTHDIQDVQSRSDDIFDVTLNLEGIKWENVHIKQYRFDKHNNTYIELAKELREKPADGWKKWFAMDMYSNDERLKIFTDQLQEDPDEILTQVFSKDEFEKVKKQSELKITKDSILSIDKNNKLKFTIEVAANGVNFIEITKVVSKN